MKIMSLAAAGAVLTAASMSFGESSAPVVSEEDVTHVGGVLDAPKHSDDYLMLALFDPAQVLDNTCNVPGLRFSFIYGRCNDLCGLDLGLVARTDSDFRGVALTGFNWNGNDVHGIQSGPFGNVTLGNLYGGQLSAIANYCRGSATGALIAPVNYLGSFTGFQMGAVNWNKSACTAFEIGAIGNFNHGDFSGFAIGGANCADNFKGFQLGIVNIVSKRGNGLQLGLINGAMNFEGVQIGLINLIANSPVAVLPLVNVYY